MDALASDNEKLRASEIFSWLANHATDLGSAGRTFGGIGGNVAHRVVMGEVLKLLGDSASRIQELRDPGYNWPMLL